MNKEKRKLGTTGLGFFIWISCIASLFLVAHLTATVISLTFLFSTYGYLAYENDTSALWCKITRYILAGLALMSCIIYLSTRSYFFLVLLQSIGSIIGLYEVLLHLYIQKGIWKKKKFSSKITYCLWILASLAAVYASIYLISIAINPNDYVHSLRTNGEVVSFDAPETKTKTWNDKYYTTNDIQYSDKYPNSYFDIYSNADNFNEIKPVFVYLHGGGWGFGDKSAGDPNASDTVGYYNMLAGMVDEGYAVISVNYALSPEYTYPTPIYQMEELIKFLKEYGSKYGLDSNNLVLGGGSAGAQIAAQFTITQTNKEYAKRMGIEQVATKGEIKALYLGCGLLAPARVTESNYIFGDYMLYQLIRAYFQAGSIENNIYAEQANIISHVTEDFPPTYITDGNYATYYKQAHELDERLTELGVNHYALIYDSQDYSETSIPHSYDTSDNKYASANLDKLAEFLQDVMSN